MTDQARSRLLVRLLSALFLLSGTSALIYQVLWLRLLGLVFGVTVYAASTVWAVFMAGLAIGSYSGGRVADRVKRPLIWFGLAEALIAITALATPLALDGLQRAYAALRPSLGDSFATLTAARLAMSFLVLIVPSTLMGSTLPLVLKSSLFRGTASLGDRVGVLYAINTAGAIAGSLLAGLVLIPRLGISASFAVAASLNVLVAIVGTVMGRRAAFTAAPVAPGPESAASAPDVHSPARLHYPRPMRLTVLAVFAASGFVSLALEVVWFRVLTLFLRPTVYSYGMMLAAVLGGIALGSYAAAPFLRRWPQRNWTTTLVGLEGGIALATLASFMTIPAAPQLVAAVSPWIAPVIGDYLAYQVTISSAVILPTMLLFGAAFPIGLHVWASSGVEAEQPVATRVGTFYSLNVAAAIAGSLATGFVILPKYGSLKTLIVLAAVSLIGAAALAVTGGGTAVSRMARAATVAVLAALFVPAARATPDPFVAFRTQRYAGHAIVWQREAVQTTVSVHQERDGNYTLNVSGNHQASTSGGMPRSHQRIGVLPMAVHPRARDALVIGLGGGATAGAVAHHPDVTVDVVELSREVVQAADRFFKPINFNVRQKPNVRLHVDDGRNYLMLTDRRYDVVTADVILPIYAGSGNLYSAEYFSLVRRALKPGGLAVQWVAGTEAEYKLIMRTFLSVFPETTLWGDGSLMLGSVEPLRLRASDFEWKLAEPRRREMLDLLGISSFDDLLRYYIAGPDELRAFVGEGPILTDDRPMVEYFLSLPRDRQVDLTGVKGDVRRHLP